jgi:uncharacterized HAD superfamily protein
MKEVVMDSDQQDYNINIVSPVLPDGIKNYLIDIDGTITDDVPNEEPWRMETCLPYDGSVEMINKWFDKGNIITFFTSRTESHRKVTEEWLNKHGYQYHGILMNKPRGGQYHIIDNHVIKATRFKGKWGKMIKKNFDIEVFE